MGEERAVQHLATEAGSGNEDVDSRAAARDRGARTPSSRWVALPIAGAGRLARTLAVAAPLALLLASPVPAAALEQKLIAAETVDMAGNVDPTAASRDVRVAARRCLPAPVLSKSINAAPVSGRVLVGVRPVWPARRRRA